MGTDGVQLGAAWFRPHQISRLQVESWSFGMAADSSGPLHLSVTFTRLAQANARRRSSSWEASWPRIGRLGRSSADPFGTWTVDLRSSSAMPTSWGPWVAWGQPLKERATSEKGWI